MDVGTLWGQVLAGFPTYNACFLPEDKNAPSAILRDGRIRLEGEVSSLTLRITEYGGVSVTDIMVDDAIEAQLFVSLLLGDEPKLDFGSRCHSAPEPYHEVALLQPMLHLKSGPSFSDIWIVL